MTIRFKKAEHAMEAVEKLNARFYNQRQINAKIANGDEKFNRTKREDQESQMKRQEAYGKWLESQD
jgi:hypothetical protein